MSRPNRPSLGQYDFALRNPPTNQPHNRSRANSRLPDYEPIRIPEVQIDSSSDDDIPVSKPRRPAQHSRSMSHPFPSLFSSKKKKNGRADDQFGDDDSTDDVSPKQNLRQNIQPNAAPRRIPRGPADFSTGNCMTCASLVRWPKELHIFRCTICLTINDLKPYDSTAGFGGTQPGTSGPVPPNGTESVPSRPLQPPPNSISLDRTRHIIKQCLRLALQSWTSVHPDRELSENWPGRSLSRPSNEYFTRNESPSKQNSSPSSAASPPSYIYNAVFDEPTGLNIEPNPLDNTPSTARSYSTSYPDARSATFPLTNQVIGRAPNPNVTVSELEPKRIFKRLEEYLISCFSSHACVNNSFVTRHMSANSRLPPEIVKKRVVVNKKEPVRDEPPISELDAKLLLLGDFAENGTWWTGSQEDVAPPKSTHRRKESIPSIITAKSPRIDWGMVIEWYHVIINAAELWPEVYAEMTQLDPSQKLGDVRLQQFEAFAIAAQEHIQRVLLKCTETLLKRPGRLMVEPQAVRFLLLMLANPLLTSGSKSYTGRYQRPSKGKGLAAEQDSEEQAKPPPGRHSGIIKRILGLLANSSEQCHHHLVTWLSRLPEHLFLQIKDLISSFITYRLTRQSEKKVEPQIDVTGGLIPQMSNSRSGNTPATLHAALEASKAKKQKQPIEPKRAAYTDDWQIRAAAKVMALIFSANNLTYVRHNRPDGRSYGHLLSTSDFYNSLVDCLDFKADFELWESKRGRFAFCQYPFFLSIWAKIQILEFDAKRQMAGKAREAFFDSILTHKNYAQYLVLSIRRDCLVEDSLKKVSEVVGSGSEDIKKGLRIEFQGEEGVDGGGLRKEWFLLLVREVFNPDHGLFVYDEDSRFCYFNPNTFETSDQYFLVGVLLGLAIYNSTILDVAFPPFAFRKLLASAPPPAIGAPAHSRPTMNYSLDDLAEFRPVLAKGLRQLLDFEGDVQSTFCLDFVIEVEKYGTRVRAPLCPGGETKMVTNANRREYVDLYVRYLLDTSVSRQFEPFKRGFFTVCAGNALTLFRPEEIELLVRGSDEALDITSLRGVAVYTGWPKNVNPRREPIVQWFWDTFERASPADQRRLLSFITSSDRIPAMGATSLVIRINLLGEDEGRFPSARTCFNILSLYRYTSKARLEECLWRAVNESEGFGLK
ncbi:uncharacterized protein GGS22DRAFT_164258 [Annulohypoxylon maeteangense]|uniref:uncharacterized protein n=1 Tax=Annulohypoxylon maeteangense TaxID=1927788 RepID=UPI0020072D15|nr:uncharacterized protein GGS22DRAFT_164258 [Annulohypoxylon maeteangense]KAI0884744.1 hypothetical protein GGS22DRAFT_164258 [Annulohypoxylon maeteangense]